MTAGVAILRTEIAVIGAGQAGLSAAYHLARRGVAPHRGFIVLDAEAGPGGAWRHRWPSLTLNTVNRIHDLPGLPMSDIVGDATEVRANAAVPTYFDACESRFELPVHRPVSVERVTRRGDRFLVEGDRLRVSARGIVSATGTWSAPHIPEIPGRARFRGRMLHTRDYRRAEDFAGQHVVIVGAGISAIQLLDEISHTARTTWVTRRPPVIHDDPFDEDRGRAAVARVEERVRAGLPPRSVVSETGLFMTPRIADMRRRGLLERRAMFDEITETGLRWHDGETLAADVILWCTGFRAALGHLSPLDLDTAEGGIRMSGRLATEVAAEPRLHLLGYGPSASTIGANRAGRAAVTELMETLGIRGESG